MSIDEWKESKLDEVCLNITDGSHTSPPSVKNGYYMASVKDMDEYGFAFEDCRMISELDYMKLIKNGCQPQYGDVLIGKDGARYLEDVLVFKQDTKVVLLSSIAILRPDKTKIISEFLYYFLSNKNTRIDIKNNYGSGSAIPRMVLKDFKRVPIPIPPIPEQKAIADTLSCLDDKIELNNRINKTLEEMAQAIFKSWFVDFEPFQDGEFEDSELGRIPKGWRVGMIDEVCTNIFSGGTPSTQNPEFWNGDLNWLSSGETRNALIIDTDKTISDEAVLNSSTRLANKYDVVIASAGQGNTRGQTSLCLIDTYINQSVISLRANGNDVSYSYLYYNLRNRYEELRKISDSSSIRGSLTTKMLKALKIVIPNIEYMQKYSLICSEIIEMSYVNAYQNKNLKSIRDSLLPKLMSGEIRVPVEDVQ